MKINFEISAHVYFKEYINEEAKKNKLQEDKYLVFSEERMTNQLDIMRELGIKWFNSWANSDVYSNNKGDIVYSEKLFNYLTKHPDIRLSSMHYIGSVFEIDNKKNQENREQMKKFIDLFGKCKPLTIVMHPGTFGEGGFQHNLPNYKQAVELLGEDEVKKRVAENISYFAKLAAPYGIKIAIENIYKGRVYSKISELVSLVEMINLDNVGYCFDVGHGNYDGVNIIETIEIMGEKLFELHITDNFGDSDGHLPVGFGNINWIEVVKTLAKINYQGKATFEFFQWPETDRRNGLILAIKMWETIQAIASNGYSTLDYM